MIIAVEGVDQAGKGTQSRMLADGLRRDGIGATLFSFPDYETPAGSRIRECLSRPGIMDFELIHTLLAKNRREKLPRIEKALREGRVLVMDRYCESNLVYGTTNGLDREWLAGLDSEMPESDMVILLDISAEESFRRKKERDAFESDRERIERVVGAYRDEAENNGKWVVVDGSREPDAIHAGIMDTVRKALGSRRDTSGL